MKIHYLTLGLKLHKMLVATSNSLGGDAFTSKYTIRP